MGRVSLAQLLLLGVPRSTIGDWVRAAFLFPRLPRVYAVGHPGTSAEADIFAAVLYAGPEALAEALGRPLPLLARTRSWFEVRLILVCELTGMRLPDDTNVEVAGSPVDAVWWDEMVVVECDGEGNHGTFRQRRRDLGEDMALRGLGFEPIRYTTDKLEDPWAIEADLGSQLRQRRGLGRARIVG
jgi:very-short-patch-repair endonuclease